MIAHQRNVFINDSGKRFEIPNELVNPQGGFSQVIEFCNQVIIKFSGAVKAHHRNIICFDRFTGDVLWLIEEGRGWIPEGNRNMYLDGEAKHSVPYGGIHAFYRDHGGHFWIEAYWNANSREWRSSLEENGLIARHPAYHNERRYRYVESDAYWIRSDTHELELWDEEAEAKLPQSGERGYRSPEERGYCGVVYYTDMTAHEEEDCLLAAGSNYGVFFFEVDLRSGRITPAYADISETK